MKYQSHSNLQVQDACFDNFFSKEQLTYFRILMAATGITFLFGLLVFIIQKQDIGLIAIIAAMTCLIFLLIFISNFFQKYLKYILGLMYLGYVIATIIVGVIGENIPQFIHGYSSGILLSTIIQFCDYKQKILFVVSTPWVFLILFDNFSVSNIHFIVYTLSTSVLLGFITYQYDNKQRCIFFQNSIIQKYKNLMRKFTSDCFLAISFDERSRIFQLEFQNVTFENTYSNGIKFFLRDHIVIYEGEEIYKSNTLEDFLFENSQNKNEWENKDSYSIRVKNKIHQNLLDLQITQVYSNKYIYFIAIKSTNSTNQIEKYENIIQKHKQSIIDFASEIGCILQELFKSLSSKAWLRVHPELLNLQKSDILIMLNRVKNNLIYYQRDKFFSISYSNGNYNFKEVLNTLMQLFEVKCKQQDKLFIFQLTSIFDYKSMRLDQKLFTQIFVNIFYSILNLSSEGSIIRFKFKLEDIKQLKPEQSEQELQNFQEILQFTFDFTSDIEIDNLDQLLCFVEDKEEINFNKSQKIESFVNFIILQLIGPYNYIITNRLGSTILEKHLYSVTFYTYIDLTKLDNSYIKQMKVWK